MRRRNKKIILIMMFGDTILLSAALWTALSLRTYGSAQEKLDLFYLHVVPFFIIFVLWTLAIGAFGLYEPRIMKNGRVFLYRLMQVMGLNVIMAITVLYLFPFAIEPRRNLLAIAILATLFIFLWRYLFNLFIARAGAARLLFCGITPEAIMLVDFMRTHPQLGYAAAGFIAGDTAACQPPASIPCFTLHKNTLSHIVRDARADIIVIAPEMKNDKTLVSALLAVIPQGIAVLEFPALHEMLTGKVPHSLIAEVWFLENLIGIKKPLYERIKRIADVAMATILGIPTLAISPVIAAAVLLSSGRPIFFRQKRVGRGGKTFEIIKFRSTWRTSVPEHEGWDRGSDGSVYTRVGVFLRKSYLDELPQLINIFRGDMSFVGPRPERPEFVERLKNETPFYEMRLLVPPGLTGWAQINMENDAAVADTPEKMQYDLYYIKNRAMMLDLLVLLRTASALLRRQGR